jgi:hypothetical protein
MAATMDRTTAELDALHAYYDCLSVFADSAIEGGGPIPEIPPMAELRVVGGWVVWNGQPVWSPLTRALTPDQPVRSGGKREAIAAWAAAEHRCLDVTQAQIERDTEQVKRGSGSSELKARNEAEHGFYSSIVVRCRRAIDEGRPFPAVPDPTELEFVDGWLVWKGQRIWWSGRHADASPSTVAAPDSGRSATSVSLTSARPRLRRLLALPWRRAAA